MLAKTGTKAIHDMALSNSDSSFLTTRSSKDTTIATVNIGAWRTGADAAFRSDVKEFSCAIHVVSFEPSLQVLRPKGTLGRSPALSYHNPHHSVHGYNLKGA